MYPIFRSSTLEKTSRFIYMLGGESVNQFADFNNFSLNFGASIGATRSLSSYKHLHPCHLLKTFQ